ncbi:Stp1/IreP family PP2C-type Ser/Thr phosphatase [Clostridium oryzae]|uniref:Stp1/IreP family PP2C-type Ser/Thr phosphatase n=1 Tax=Clostridium oryzae TaxID=1450648 RepID=UPI003119B439
MIALIGALSDVGNTRELNEDYMASYTSDSLNIYIIADGMGGHNAGEVASKTAVESVIEYVKKAEQISDIGNLLKRAIIYANDEVNKLSQQDDQLNGMGTTITACITDGDNYIVANVGDSSCYVLADKKLIKVTKDHSLVQQLIDEGSITEDEGKNHPNKNIITRAVGTGSDIEVDLFELDTNNLEKIILCTDGLTNEIELDDMSRILDESNSDNMQACRELVELAKKNGGRDNITVMVIEGKC